MVRITISTTPFSVEDELARFAEQRSASAGAVASFVGYCRGDSPVGAVENLHLDHYPGFTETEIERLAQTIAERHSLIALKVVHRAGRVAPLEPIVLVAAMSAHRAEAFAAVAELMDYLKTDAPFWKREEAGGQTSWIEPTEADRARRAARGE